MDYRSVVFGQQFVTAVVCVEATTPVFIATMLVRGKVLRVGEMVKPEALVAPGLEELQPLLLLSSLHRGGGRIEGEGWITRV